MRRENGVPLYKRIKEEIVSRIAGADLAHGEALPTRSELAERFQTTRATVDRAMQELARDGIVVGGSGRRTLVNRPSLTARSVAVVWSAPEEHISGAGAEFFGPLNGGIRRACAEFMLEVHFRPAQPASYADALAETGAQGLLVLRPDYSDIPHLEQLSRRDVAVVTVPGILEAEHIASISSDNFSGMARAVDHLVELGHREIAFVCLTSTIPDHFERLQGFLQAMGRHRLPIDPRWLYLTHALHSDDFSRLCREWLDQAPLPTAIIASDFLMALAVLRGLNDLRVSVPHDVSLLSIDDPPAASHIVPALTVMRQQVSLLAYQGVQRLVQKIQGRETPLVTRIPMELVVRESTTRPPQTVPRSEQ